MMSQRISVREGTDNASKPGKPGGSGVRRRGIRLGEGRLGTPLSQALFVLCVIAVWMLVRALQLISADVLPSFTDTILELLQLWGTAEYWSAIGATLGSALQGLAIAAIIGIPLGLMTGSFPPAERATRVIVDFGRSFPVVALLPVFLLVIGSNGTMKATIVFLACLFPLFLQAQYGARGVEPMITETARSFRIPTLLKYRRVVLPSATPSIMTGLRLATISSVLVAVGVEILTTLPGIGHMIVQTQLDQNSPRSYAYILTASFIGYGVNRLSQAAEKRFLRWRPPADNS